MNYSNDTYERGNAVTALMWKVYFWMSAALAISAVTAYSVFSNPQYFALIVGNKWAFWGIMIAELALVIVLSTLINKMNCFMALCSFLLYSFLSGLTLSVIFAVFQSDSIVTVFMVTAAMFACMAMYGYFTKADLTQLGQLLFMALLGMIIASLVNLFLQSSMMNYVISFIGVFVFTGLIAYDVQKIKQIAQSMMYQGAQMQKIAILGALTLYLDFVNLFLSLLQLFGKRRD